MVCLVYNFPFRHWDGLTFFSLTWTIEEKMRTNVNEVRSNKKPAPQLRVGPENSLSLAQESSPAAFSEEWAVGRNGVLHLFQEHEQTKEKKREKFLTLFSMNFPKESNSPYCLKIQHKMQCCVLASHPYQSELGTSMVWALLSRAPLSLLYR